ncbi:MAG: hypothetical protein R8M45_00240, partial [Ghiorsea sp.]
SSEVLTETVEFISGAGSVAKPISSLGAVKWLTTPLSGVTFVVGSTSLTAANAGSSLAEVTYTSAYNSYSISGNSGDKAQFLVEVL